MRSGDETQRSDDRPRSRSRRPSIALLLGGLMILALVGGGIVYWTSARDRESGALTHRLARGSLIVSIVEQGTLESSNNTEIKCQVRGFSTVNWVIPSGSVVEKDQELVRLDTKVIEETVSLTKTNVDLAKAKLARSSANVSRSELAINAYLDGDFRSQMQALERDRKIAETNLETARKMLEQSRSFFRRGYVTDLEVKGNAFTVKQAELELEVNATRIDVLERFTKKMRLSTLRGGLRASQSKMAADEAELAMTIQQRDRAGKELAACVVRAERGGLAVTPSAAAWKDTPDITEGATVRKDQVLLLMPDLARMQVKIGVHESIVDRMKVKLRARVTLPDRVLEAEVTKVSTIASPAGWWTGNVVKYDTVIELPSVEGLKPGMSAEVEVFLARHENVLNLPVAAVLETERGSFAWVKTPAGPERRVLRLGDSNDVFLVVLDGVSEDEEVILHPLGTIAEARQLARAIEGEPGTPITPSPGAEDES